MSARTEFDDLLISHLIPDFCSDPSRRFNASNFVASSNRVSDEDAIDFLRAWNAGLPMHQGRGQYLLGVGRVREQFFWTGSKTAEPRSFTLWMEPIITVGAIGRLHLDHGWPLSRFAAQSADWAYDIVAIASDGKSTAIAGEVKKTGAEIDALIELMQQFGANPEAPTPAAGRPRNAFKKVLSLRKSRAPLLWLIGPCRRETVFEVEYAAHGVLTLQPAGPELLGFHS